MDEELDRLCEDREALARLVEQHRILKEAVEQSPVHFAVYDSADCLIAWNAPYEENYPTAFERLRERAVAGRMTYADLIATELAQRLEPEAVEAEVRSRVRLQAQANGEPVLREYDGHTLRVYKYRLPSGAVAGFAVDITDLVEREAQLVEARRGAEQAARAKAAFLANMSHEIRTPMNGVIGVASLLSQTPLSEEQRDHLSLIEQSAETLLETINSILDFSKIEAGRLSIASEPFDLRKLCAETVSLMRPMAESKGLALRLSFPDATLSWFVGDALRLRQCLLNLVGNAIKFTRSGHVEMRVDQGSPGEVSIAVEDTGIGIPPEKLSHIFNAFEQVESHETREFEGTGLGLSITRRIVELLGGSIEARSGLNGGSTFTIALSMPPAPPGATVEEPEIEADEMPDLSGRRILLADDSRTNQFVFRRLLEESGAEIESCFNGQEAVEAFRGGGPDVIFMDVSMPVMSGIEATREIRALEHERDLAPVPIVALTAYAMEEDRERCVAVGMSDFVSKPFRRHDLIAAIHRTLPQCSEMPLAGAVEKSRAG
ncbi:MAG: ATP-binding protein [Pseudomonadota bacterium]